MKRLFLGVLILMCSAGIVIAGTNYTTEQIANLTYEGNSSSTHSTRVYLVNPTVSGGLQQGGTVYNIISGSNILVPVDIQNQTKPVTVIDTSVVTGVNSVTTAVNISANSSTVTANVNNFPASFGSSQSGNWYVTITSFPTTQNTYVLNVTTVTDYNYTGISTFTYLAGIAVTTTTISPTFEVAGYWFISFNSNTNGAVNQYNINGGNNVNIFDKTSENIDNIPRRLDRPTFNLYVVAGSSMPYKIWGYSRP